MFCFCCLVCSCPFVFCVVCFLGVVICVLFVRFVCMCFIVLRVCVVAALQLVAFVWLLVCCCFCFCISSLYFVCELAHDVFCVGFTLVAELCFACWLCLLFYRAHLRVAFFLCFARHVAVGVRVALCFCNLFILFACVLCNVAACAFVVRCIWFVFWFGCVLLVLVLPCFVLCDVCLCVRMSCVLCLCLCFVLLVVCRFVVCLRLC